MYYIDPITITDALLLAGTTVAEPAAGETLWVSAGTYVIGDRRIRATTHRVYQCVLGHTGITALPENDPTRWQDVGPTQKYAPFDYYASTAVASTSANVTYVLAARYVNSLYVEGLAGSTVTVSVKDMVGGTVVYTRAQSVKRSALGYWDYAYGQRALRNRMTFDGLPIYPAAEITVTVAASGADLRKLGNLVMGKLYGLQAQGWGGTQWDAQAIPKSYTYRKTASDGTFQIVSRGSAVDLDCSAMIDIAYADQAVATLTALQGKPIVWIATLAPRFDGLTTFGFASKPSISYKPSRAEISNYIEGIVT